MAYPLRLILWALSHFTIPCWNQPLSLWTPKAIAAAAAAKSLQLCLTLCDPTDGSPSGSPIPGILQARTHFLLLCMKVKSESEVTQSYPTPSDPMDCSLPGSFIHGIFQARVLEWGATAFSAKDYCLVPFYSTTYHISDCNMVNCTHVFCLTLA